MKSALFDVALREGLAPEEPVAEPLTIAIKNLEKAIFVCYESDRPYGEEFQSTIKRVITELREAYKVFLTARAKDYE